MNWARLEHQITKCLTPLAYPCTCPKLCTRLGRCCNHISITSPQSPQHTGLGMPCSLMSRRLCLHLLVDVPAHRRIAKSHNQRSTTLSPVCPPDVSSCCTIHYDHAAPHLDSSPDWSQYLRKASSFWWKGTHAVRSRTGLWFSILATGPLS